MSEKKKHRYYKGKSMKGVFLPGDLMMLEHVSIDRLTRGDVVVFEELDLNGSGKDVVHRIISISKNGFVTRGDNNFYNDTNLLTVSNFVGRVIYRERNGKELRVKNGRSGLLIAKLHHLKLKIKKVIWGIIRIPYGKLKKSNIVSKFWKPEIKKIQVKTPEGELIKYIHNNRTIGQVWTKTGKFKIKKPYDLIIERQEAECSWE